MNRDFKFLFGLAVFLVFLQMSSTFARAQSTFYIDNGQGIRKVENGDPTKIKVIDWVVRLYKKGRPTGGNDNWGAITGKSADSVMAKLKKAQDFELRFNAWIGKGRVPDEINTHFNPLGPIANVERDPTERDRTTDNKRLIPKDTWDKIQDLIEKAKVLREGYNTMIDIITREPDTSRTPFDKVGNVLKEYMENLRDVFERVAELRRRIEGATSPALDELNRAIGELIHSFEIAANSGRRVGTGLGVNPDDIVPPGVQPKPAEKPVAPAPAQTASDATERRLEELSNQLANAFENMDPNNPEVVFQRINAIARQMMQVIESDPSADANMKELARILLSITESTDMEALAGKLERLTELMERMSK